MDILKRYGWLTGLGITLLFLLLAAWIRPALLDLVDLKLYDLMAGLRTEAQSPSEIVMVEIDDRSIETLGRWPWPRSLLAEGISKINDGRPKAIGLNLAFNEPEANAGLAELNALRQAFAQTLLSQTGEAGEAFFDSIRQAMENLDNDRKLAEAIAKAGNVVLPVSVSQTEVATVLPAGLRTVLEAETLAALRNPRGLVLPRANAMEAPIEPLLNAAAGIGHLQFIADSDGTTRRQPLIYDFQGFYLPGYILRLAALHHGVAPGGIQGEIGTAIRIGSLEVPVNGAGELLVGFKGPRGSFESHPFSDLIQGRIPPQRFHDKLVLVSPSAAAITNPVITPVQAGMSPGEFSAHALWSILARRSIAEPLWGHSLELLLIAVIGVAICLLLPRLKALNAAIVSAVLLASLLGGALLAYAGHGIRVPVGYPLVQLVLGGIAATFIRRTGAAMGGDKASGESAETDRMLGLSFQSQGMLDMAFEKFRRVPVDDQMKDILYNLALDYERKHELNKATAVFEYIEDWDADFRDVAERKTRLMQASDTVVFGDAMFGASSGESLLAAAGDTHPTLGRYEVLRELGKGAMGIVYLGQDPRINRTVAIKTFHFSEGLEPEQAEELKQKFFREAESAGTLSHPNIVTIYDAGDEQELAYIAMEFLEGESLEKYTQKGNLLPLRRVIDIVADVADALDYAHQKGIVHRDIKPANIMLLKNGAAKITDFGIARIAATSQTQTGVVKGTPYYMSPEQFSGERVDGRSDIFSLGTMLFQMLTGRLPFHGDSPPALMNCIMNTPHPDPRRYNPRIVTPLVKIIDKALEKDRGKRYQRAIQMAMHLRELGRRIDAAILAKKSAVIRPQ